MVRMLCVALLAGVGAVTAAEDSYFSFAEAFTAGDGQALEVSYRVYTAPMLTDIAASGVMVERLEIWPQEIHLAPGAILSLQHLQITAFGPDGNVQERAPLMFDLQGPPDLLDFEDFITYGTGIRAVRPGRAKIWITSAMPSSGGEQAKVSIELVVIDQGLASGDEAA